MNHMQSDPQKERLLAAIEQAFGGVRLEDGVSINMAEYHDSGGSVPRYLELAQSDEREDWRKLTDTLLEKHDVTLSFADFKGFRFHLPAYMHYAVRNHEWSNYPIVGFVVFELSPDHPAFANVPFEQCFNREQIAVIIQFLEYCIVHEDSLNGATAAVNLNKIRERLDKGVDKVSG
jgi:hypothetical protein